MSYGVAVLVWCWTVCAAVLGLDCFWVVCVGFWLEDRLGGRFGERLEERGVMDDVVGRGCVVMDRAWGDFEGETCHAVMTGLFMGD